MNNPPQVYDDEKVTLTWLFKNSFCWKCHFLDDCRRKVLRKELDSPYCFDDSKMHYQFEKVHGNMMSIVEVDDELPIWTDISSE